MVFESQNQPIGVGDLIRIKRGVDLCILVELPVEMLVMVDSDGKCESLRLDKRYIAIDIEDGRAFDAFKDLREVSERYYFVEKCENLAIGVMKGV